MSRSLGDGEHHASGAEGAGDGGESEMFYESGDEAVILCFNL